MASNFGLTVNSPQTNIIQSLNYLLSTQGVSTTGNGTVTGNVVQVGANNAIYTTVGIIGYVNPFMDVKYANSATGSSGFTSNSQQANYYGVYNTASQTVSNNPTDYQWTQVAGGFGTTNALYYTTGGGGTISFFIGNAAPNNYYQPVPDNIPIVLAGISSNLVVTKSITTSNVTTAIIAPNAATNTITVQDTTSYPTIQYTNGANTNPSSNQFLWPSYTRGFAIGGGAPITTTTNGSATGSKITVSYSAYIYSDRNPTYNCVELYKTGASSYYKNTFLGSSSNYESNYPYKDNFLLVGTNGSQFFGNLGNIVSQISPTTTQDLYDAYVRAGQPFQEWYGYGNNGQYDVGGAFTNFSGNLSYFYSSNPPYGAPNYGSPLFNIYGINEQITASNTNTILVGASGRIATQTGYSTILQTGGFTNETSNTFNDLNYVDSSTGYGNYVNNTNIYYVAVGVSGTIIYNTKTYNSSGNIGSSSGWTQAVSNTTVTLNSVASNYNGYFSGNSFISTNGNAFVAVGNQGTIVYCNNAVGNGPWLRANSVPTTNNLNGVKYANGTWVAVGDAGTIITSADGSNWTTPVANPAATNGRNLYTIVPGYSSGRWVAGGQEIIISSDTTNPNSTWSNQYFSSSSVNQTLTRLQYFGSWANVANVSQPPSNQQVTNQQIFGGTYTDINYTAGQTITYYLVLGNMAGNAVITTNSPSITVTEYKR